jgi:hypothetical protein
VCVCVCAYACTCYVVRSDKPCGIVYVQRTRTGREVSSKMTCPWIYDHYQHKNALKQRRTRRKSCRGTFLPRWSVPLFFLSTPSDSHHPICCLRTGHSRDPKVALPFCLHKYYYVRTIYHTDQIV